MNERFEVQSFAWKELSLETYASSRYLNSAHLLMEKWPWLSLQVDEWLSEQCSELLLASGGRVAS